MRVAPAETLAPEQRQPLSWRGLARNYGRVLGDARFVSLGLAFSLVFAAQGFLIGAAPDFITNVLGLQETDFAYLFVPLVIGAMLGALFAARAPAAGATRASPRWPIC